MSSIRPRRLPICRSCSGPCDKRQQVSFVLRCSGICCRSWVRGCCRTNTLPTRTYAPVFFAKQHCYVHTIVGCHVLRRFCSDGAYIVLSPDAIATQHWLLSSVRSKQPLTAPIDHYNDDADGWRDGATIKKVYLYNYIVRRSYHHGRDTD